MHSIERYHDFSAGHRVVGHEHKCRYLHGHNYRVHFSIRAKKLDSIGRVIDFDVVKSVLCCWLERNWDHKMLLWNEDPEFADGSIARIPVLWDSVVRVPFNPTAENIAKEIVLGIAPHLLPGNVELFKCKVEETRKCSATYEL